MLQRKKNKGCASLVVSLTAILAVIFTMLVA